MGGRGTWINTPASEWRAKALLAEELAASETRKTESRQRKSSRRCSERGQKLRPIVSRVQSISKKKPLPPEMTLAESGASRSRERSGRKIEGGEGVGGGGQWEGGGCHSFH